MPRSLFLNVAVKDLKKSIAFFTELGFTFNPQFTDETGTCMVVSDTAYVMLLTVPRFKDFTKKEMIDPSRQIEGIFAVSAESRKQVDELCDRALALGATKANDPTDMGFMYLRSFNDLDGHAWEIFWMDPNHVQK